MKEQEALQLIETVISKTKKDLTDNGIFYLIWGWAVFIAALSHLALEVMPIAYIPSPFVWPIFMSTAGIISAIIAKKQMAKQQVKSYAEEFIKTMWFAFGISLALSIFITLWAEPMLCYPIVLIFYGMGTFTVGKIIKFKPLIIGGIICWLLSIASLFVNFNTQLAILAAGILISYIIPGHILYKQAK